MIEEKNTSLIKGMTRHALTSDPHEEYMTKWSRSARRGVFFEDPSLHEVESKRRRENKEAKTTC